MLLITEGIDGTGKTTLSEYLSNQLKLRYNKENKPEKEGFPYYLSKSLKLKDYSITDRFHIGEAVYPKVKNDGRKPLEVWQQQMIERVLLSRGAMIIYCCSSKEQIEKVYKERGENYVTIDEYPFLNYHFEQSIASSLLPIIRYNYTKVDLKSMKDSLLDYYYNFYKHSFPLTPYNYLGTAKGNVFVLTEGFSKPFSDYTQESIGYNKILSRTGPKNLHYTTSVDSYIKSFDVNCLKVTY